MSALLCARCGRKLLAAMHLHVDNPSTRWLISVFCVTLNDERVPLCIEVCEEGGWVRQRVAVQRTNGQRQSWIVARPPQTRILYGQVRVRLIDEWSHLRLGDRYYAAFEALRQQRHHCLGPAHEWPDGYCLCESMPHGWLDQYPFVAQLLQTPEEELLGYMPEDTCPRPPAVPDPTPCDCPLCVAARGEPGEE
jgi:hypothetical protein